MASKTNSFEQFGLVVRVPIDSEVYSVDGQYPYNSNSIFSPTVNNQTSSSLTPNCRHVDVVDGRNSNRSTRAANHVRITESSGLIIENPCVTYSDMVIEDASKNYPYRSKDYDISVSPSKSHVMPAPYPYRKATSKINHVTAIPNYLAKESAHETVSAERISVQHSFDEMVADQPSQNKRTLVVLDCANICWAHGESQFDVNGIQIALAFFKSYEVDVISFIPSSYVKKKPRDKSAGNSMMETEDRQHLEALIRMGDVTVVPAGDHDDVYILSYARSNNGFIVSNDFFADHIASIEEMSIKRSMKLWLNVNRCGFTFLKNSSFMINPGNVLSTVLGYMAFQERKLDFDAKCSLVIDSITSSIQVLFHNECFQQLKYVLLARAVSYMEVRSTI